jgi:hypothetical protein
MINFYTDTTLINEKNRKRIFPLFLDLFFLKNHALEFFQLEENLEKVQVYIFPLEISYPKNSLEITKLNNFIDLANKYNKKVWVYSGGDFGRTIDINNVITFRLGGFHSKLNANTQILPLFINDVYRSNFQHQWEPLSKETLPTLGFVGHANGTFIKLLKELIIYSKNVLNRIVRKDLTDFQVFYPSSRKRFLILKKLKSSTKIKSSFIFRNKYKAGAFSQEMKKLTNQEFLNNINDNLYTFCMRGSGNFSARFYETLVMGRIPLIIDTDIRLPLSKSIDWNKHCVLVHEKNVIDGLINFHESHTNEQMQLIQKNNRQLILENLSRVNYFKKIYNSYIDFEKHSI